MGCCSKNTDADDIVELAEDMEKLCKKEVAHKPFPWNPTIDNVQQIAYVRRLECQQEALQSSFFTLATQLARLQFRIRQLINAEPCKRGKLIQELERVVFKEISVDQIRSDELPALSEYHACMGDVKRKQLLLINNLRRRIGKFPMPDDERFESGVDLGKGKKKIKQPSICEEPTVPLSKKSSICSRRQSKVSVRSSESNSRKPGGSEALFENTSSMTTETQKIVAAEASERSISFKELRDIYQKQCTSS